METVTKLTINQRVFATILLIVIIVSAYLFYKQAQFIRQQDQWQNQLSTFQQNFQQWQSNPFNNEQSALVAARALINQANINFQSKQNPTFILNLLRTAQQEIVLFHEPKIAALQAALQSDIVMLEKIPTINLIEIAHHMNTLNEKIESLKFLELQATPPMDNANPENNTWGSVRAALSNVINVQHLDQSVTPILSSHQKIAVQQYLRELLQQTWWAAEQHDNVLYQASLKNIVLTLNLYVVNGTKAVQPTLENLQKINVTQIWPPQLQSPNVFQQWLTDLTTKDGKSS